VANKLIHIDKRNIIPASYKFRIWHLNCRDKEGVACDNAPACSGLFLWLNFLALTRHHCHT